jgi:peptidyl-prolyl cis-trans isomerase D
MAPGVRQTGYFLRHIHRYQMLETMRKGASGWLAKILLVLLVASFAVWGIGSDMLGSSATSDLIEVGDQKVSFGEFQVAYNRNVQNVSQQFRTQITPEMAKQMGIARQTIGQLVGQSLLKENVSELSVAVPDDVVAKAIKSSREFQNATGQFDSFRFEAILRQNGYSEDSYIAAIRDDLETQQILGSINSVLSGLPKVAINRIYAFESEKRIASYIALPDANISFAPAPTDDELTKFISDNAADYTAPEYRKIDYISMQAKDFVFRVDVTDAELTAEYDGRKSEFFQPARRTILQMIFADEAKAKAAARKIKSGADFAATALETLQLTAEDINLGDVTKTDLLDELQVPVFALAEGDVTDPVKTVLGWHVVKSAKNTSEFQKNFEDVKDQLKNDIALRKASSLIYDASTKIEDELAGGSTLSEVATATDLKVKSTGWIDDTAKTDLGQDATDIPQAPEFLAEAFSRKIGDDPALTAAQGDVYFVLSVTEIRDSKLRDLADVKTKATDAWQANWRHEKNKETSEKFVAELKAGKTLDALAAEQSATIKKSTQILRRGPSGVLSSSARDDLFAMSLGDTGSSENQDKDGFTLYALSEIVAADLNKEKDAVASMDRRAASALRNDILQLYEGHLRKEYGVSVNEGLIREYF